MKMEYEKATRWGRVLPSMASAAAKPLTAEQKRRRQFLRDYRIKELNGFIAQYSGRPGYYSTISKWRHELIDLYTQF